MPRVQHPWGSREIGAATAALVLSACAHPAPLLVNLDAASPAVDAAESLRATAAGRAPAFIRRPAWARRLGGAGAQTVEAMAVDAAGNVVIAGTFSETADFGAGPLQAGAAPGEEGLFVALLDESGRARWSRAFGGVSENERLSVAFDGEGNVVLAGGIAGPAIDFGAGPLPPAGAWDVLVVKLDPSGRSLWARRFGGPDYQTATSLAVDPAGNILVGGGFTGAAIDFGLGALPGAGHPNLFVVALDPDGHPRWNRSFGGVAHLAALAVDEEGNAVIAGHFFQSLDLGLGPLRSAGSSDAFVAKLDPAGQALWSRRFGSVEADSVSAIAVDRAGDIAVAGENRGPLDLGARAAAGVTSLGVYAAVLDPAGKVRWARGTGTWAVHAAVFDGAGNLFLHGVSHQSGDFTGTRAGRPLPVNQVSAVAFSPAGALLWSGGFGPTPPSVVVAAAGDRRNDDILFAATTIGDPLDLGTIRLPGPDRDVLLVKLSR